MTVTVAAWTDEEARVRAALASCCSWREMGGVGQVVLEVCWAEPGQVGTKPTYTRSPKGTKTDAELRCLPGLPDLSYSVNVTLWISLPRASLSHKILKERWNWRSKRKMDDWKFLFRMLLYLSKRMRNRESVSYTTFTPRKLVSSPLSLNKVMMVVRLLRVVSESLWPHGLLPARLLYPLDFPGKNTGGGCHFLLQGIFPTQGSNLGLLHCRWILYWLSYQGSSALNKAGYSIHIWWMNGYTKCGVSTRWNIIQGFSCGSAGKEPACNVGDLGSIPGLGRSPGEGKGYPLQYSGLENSMDCIVHGVAKSWTWLSNLQKEKKTSDTT